VRSRSSAIKSCGGSPGFRNKDRGDGVFPAILDTGCNNTLVASLWTLQVWARSAAYDVLDCKILDLVQETVANTSGRSPGPALSKPKRWFNQPLRALAGVWNSGQLQDWLALIESDLWLSQNAPGERDELAAPGAWFRLQVPGVLVRAGSSARPPVLGMWALEEGHLVLGTGSLSRLEALAIDLRRSTVSLSYA
jgi:hypothetical protein